MEAGMKKNNSDLISKLFFSLLPVQILIFAMGFINTIVDGVMAGRFIDPDTVGVIGLYFSMVNIFNAVGAVLLGGTAVLCGRYLGRGDLNRTNGIFSLNMTVTLIVAVVLTVINLVIPGPIATILGANEGLKHDLVIYIIGYSIGIIPMLMAQQIAAFLQLERQSRLGYIGIACMVLSNVILDVLLVAVFDMGILGLAVATSLSNWVYFLILAPYYISSKSHIRFDRHRIPWGELPELLKIGFPGALLVFCISIRVIVINRILLKYSGNDGLSAMGAFNMVYGLFIAYCIGNGNVVRMLTSVFVGEEDKNSMRKVLKIVLGKSLLMACAVGAAALVISGPVAALFFPDTASNVYKLTHQLIAIYACCIPLILLVQVSTNYLQAIGHNVYVNIQSVFDGFFSMVIPSVILAPSLGALGVWLANPIGIILTLFTVFVYELVYWKRLPRTIDEWMFIRPGFGVSEEDCLDIPIHSMEEVSRTSELVQDFCDAHEMAHRPAYYSALCLEEMAGNVISHGFNKDKKNHALNARVVYLRDTVLLRLKDDCIPFDPSQMAGFVSDKDPFRNVGIKMVYGIADDVTYQNLLGLNVLTIKIKEENLAAMEATDYLLEKRLKALDPDLHRRFKDTAFTGQRILQKYKALFPEYTDHSMFHSLTVIDSCNRIIGRDNINRLNEDEIFVLLMACYLHDVGMGIAEKDYGEFKDIIGEKQFFEKYPDETKAEFVRFYHNEFSGLFIDKYADIFDLPSAEHVFAVKQVARGHRKTDLYDEKEYPVDLKMPGGNTVNLPYLAAVIRLADEIDVAASRNPILLYDIDLLRNEFSILENRKLMAVESVKMTRSSFIVNTKMDDKVLVSALRKMVVKMQETLDYCRAVVGDRTQFEITQKKVILVLKQGSTEKVL